MTLRDLAPVRALAAERARDVHDAAVRAIKARHFGSYAQSLIDALPPMWVDVDAHLAIITDLSRPDSRDAVARLVAAKVGIECGATAPEFRQTTGSLGGWVLNGGKGVRSVHEFVTRAPHPARGNLPTRGVTLVPALLGVNDPAEAIRLIALAVLSEKA